MCITISPAVVLSVRRQTDLTPRSFGGGFARYKFIVAYSQLRKKFRRSIGKERWNGFVYGVLG